MADKKPDGSREDLRLIRRAEEVLAELDRNQGLSPEHASVLAALRIRIHGAPRKSLDDVIQAAGDIKGKVSLEDVEIKKREGSLEDILNKPPERKEWPD